MDDIIQEATEAYEQGRDAGYAVGDLLRIIKNQTVEIDILIRKKKTLRDEIAEKDAEIDRQDVEIMNLKHEIERLKENQKSLISHIICGKEIMKEAIIDFADKVKDATFHYYDSEIDEIAKELTKEE